VAKIPEKMIQKPSISKADLGKFSTFGQRGPIEKEPRKRQTAGQCFLARGASIWHDVTLKTWCSMTFLTTKSFQILKDASQMR